MSLTYSQTITVDEKEREHWMCVDGLILRMHEMIGPASCISMHIQNTKRMLVLRTERVVRGTWYVLTNTNTVFYQSYYSYHTLLASSVRSDLRHMYAYACMDDESVQVLVV